MTIVSGATAERMDYAGYLMTRWPFPPSSWKLPSFLFCSVLVTGVVYPIGTHWSWTGLGWLAQEWEPITKKQMQLIDNHRIQGFHWFCRIGSGSSCWCCSFFAWLCHPRCQVLSTDFLASILKIFSTQDWQMEKGGRNPWPLDPLCLSRVSHPRLWIPRLQRRLPGLDQQCWRRGSIFQSCC